MPQREGGVTESRAAREAAIALSVESSAPLPRAAHHTLHHGEVLLDVGGNLNDVILHVGEHLVISDKLPPRQVEAFAQALDEGSAELSVASLGHGVGVVRLAHEGVEEAHCTLVRPREPLAATDGRRCCFLWVVVGPDGETDPSDEELEPFGWMLLDDAFTAPALAARTPRALLDLYAAYLAGIENPRPSIDSELPDELQPTGKLFGGVVADVRRRAPHYVDDFVSGLHPKTLAATFYLFFACLAPAVAFGGLSAVLTGGEIGAIETLVATAAVGIVYALTSGQPLTILRSTGPVIVFTGMLYGLTQEWGVPFLPTYAWVGIWTMGFLVLFAATETARFVRYMTRFTDEVFAALMSLIFIVEAVKDTARVFRDPDEPYDTALLSLLLALGTYMIAIQLSGLRRSRYLRRVVRELFADFGPAIAIIAMTAVAFALHPVRLDTLAVPSSFQTSSGRPWLVPIADAPLWVMLAAAVPAFLISVLLFVDQVISVRLVASPQYGLKKGSGYHLDLLVIGLGVGVSSLFGLPWLVAATVRSLNHVRSLATFSSAGGEERIVAVRETRLTSLLVHLLIAGALLFLEPLQQVPMSVLFGLFLFMGVASLRNNQLFERLRLWVTDPSMYPPTHYLRRVPAREVHKFTAIQASALGLLWLIKVSPIGIFFPLFLALLVPLRILLRRFFDRQHLRYLDTHEAPDEEAHRELD